MKWQIEYSLRNNKYLMRRFLKGLSFAIIVVYGFMIGLMLLGLNSIQNHGFFASGYGYMFIFISGFFWFTTFFLFLGQMITYTATYQLNEKAIMVRIKANKPHKVLLGVLDLINTGTYKNQPYNVSIHRLSSQGSLKMTWRKVTRIRVFQKQSTILIKGQLGEKMPVFYTTEQSQAILELLKTYWPKTEIIE